MTARISTIAAGRLNEFVNRVNNNDPATSGFIAMLLQDTGLETMTVLRDYDDFAAILASTNTECSVASYNRIVLTDADIGAYTVDDANNRIDFDIADQSFGSLETGQNIAAVIVGYAPDTAGADSTIIPCKITIPTSAVATTGNEFFWRTPSGLWRATAVGA